MTIRTKASTALLFMASCLLWPLFATTPSAFDKGDIDRKLAAIVTYERGMDREPLIAVERLIRESQRKPEQCKYVEQRLADLLAGATLEVKSFICKQLWSIGTAASVPAVAKLLTSEDTADMACYAIGQNPSPEAGKALRDALSKTPSKVQIRIIALLGDRRDAESVDAIGAIALTGDKQVGEAAVTALGKIGGAGARKVLAEARAKGDADLKFAATDAYLRCAEDLAFDGEDEQAAAIYKELTGPDEVAIFRSAAIRGLADIGGADAAVLVIAALRDENRTVRTTAAGCVRTMEGEGVTELIAAEVPTRPAAEQALLIGALADRGDAAGLPAIIAATRSADATVRKAALQAVGKLGDKSSVALLVEFASGGAGSEEIAATINSLELLSGDGVDLAITKNMQNSPPTIRPELIRVLSDRNAVGAVDALLTESLNPDSKVRRAAFKALGRLAEQKDLPSLVGLLVKTQNGSGSRDAERAVIVVARKIADEDARADVVLTALSAAKRVAVQCSLIRVLGGIANSRALDILTTASQLASPTLRDTAVRTLAQWPNASAAKVLLKIYRGTENQIHRVLALRGFARLLALPAGERPATESLGMCKQAMRKARSADEKKLVLSGLGNVAHQEALAMAERFLEIEAVRAEAAMAVIKIAVAIGQTQPDKSRAAINKVLAIAQSPHLREQAEQTLRRIEAEQKQPEQDQ